MTPPLNQEYEKVLDTPVILEGSRKDVIDAIQKQIDIRFEEINKLRSTQNSHVPISGLPAELLSEVFLCIVESGLQYDNTSFTWGTFGFRQVCKHWNEVAIGFPQLWVRWATSAVRAWPLFDTRSKGAPICLTLRSGSITALAPGGILTDPTIPGRVRMLDFSGAGDHLECLLGVFGSNHSSNVSSIRLHATRHSERGPREHTVAFLSLSFPKLSKLDIKTNFLPDFSSPIFTTSNLISLKLGSHHRDGVHYTQSQFSEILQRHSDLQELHLWRGGMPLVEPSGPSVPVAPPRLVDLRLYGTEVMISGIMGLVGMTSPLYNVIIHFESTSSSSISNLTNTVKEIIASYYECQGPDHPRRANHLAISNSEGRYLTFNVGSRSTSKSHPASNLELRFDGVDNMLAERICLLFPLGDILEFTAAGLDLTRSRYRRILQMMRSLEHLRLDHLDIGPVLDELSGPSAQYLQSLTLTNLEIWPDLDRKLVDVVDGGHTPSLESLAVRSCTVYDHWAEWRLGELVERIIWEDVVLVSSESESSYSEGTESDEDSHACM